MATSMGTNILKHKARVLCASWSQTVHKRYLQTTICHLTEVETNPDSALDSEKIVLDFFNNCDAVALRKVLGKNLQMFQFTEQEDILRRGTLSNRFSDLKNVCLNVTGMRESMIPRIAKQIVELKEEEEQCLGIRNLHPQLTVDDVKDINTVVAVDVFRNEIAWAEETRDRELVSVGHEILLPKSVKSLEFDHLKYPDRIATVLEAIPKSPVYLMSKSTANGEQIVSHRAMVLSLVILMLNMRSRLGTEGFFDLKAISNMVSQHENFPNVVHVMPLWAMNDFYDIMTAQELLSHAFVFSHWMRKRNSELAGLKWNEKTELMLTSAVGRQQMTKCVLMADSFCKCLRKSPDKFPRMYS